MSSMPAAILALAVLELSVAVCGAQIEVFVVAGGPSQENSRASGVVVAELSGNAPEGSSQRIERTVALPGQLSLQLDPDKLWRLSFLAAGFWSEPRTLQPSKGGAVRLTAWPTGTLTGLVTVPRGESLPEEMSLRFEPSEGAPEVGQIPRSLGRCPVEEGHWTCEMPAMRADLRLRATGFVSHFFWNVELRAGGTRQLGSLRLERGGSVVGRVTALDGDLSPECKVRLALSESGESDSTAGKERLRRLAHEEKPDERGFFHFKAVSPGSYTVSAEQPGSAPARIFPVTVMKDAETEIRSPLELTPPLALEVRLTPPVGLSGRPWKLEVLQLSPIPGSVDAVFEGLATEEGRFVQEGLPPARYAVFVKSPEGDKLAAEVFELTPATTTLELDLPVLMVEGTLSLGDEPLSAELVFGGLFGIQRAYLVSDEKGDFVGTLPRPGEWLVYVEAEDPHVRRSLMVDVEPEDGVARVDLELPATRLSGQVVDSNGRPVVQALVKVFDPRIAEEVVDRTDAEGRFFFEALAEGRNVVWAGHLEAGRSAEVAVDVVEKLDPNLTLTLRPARTVSGRVVGPAGPVPGTLVLAKLYGETGAHPFFMESSKATTGVDGKFEMEIPESAHRLQIIALPPGYALAPSGVTEVPERPVVISVEQASGTVVFELDEPFIWEDRWKPRPGLWIDGAPLDRFVLQEWAAVQSINNQGKEEYRVPALPPGRVTACWAAPTPETFRSAPEPRADICQQGFLGPGDELRFRFKSKGE